MAKNKNVSESVGILVLGLGFYVLISLMSFSELNQDNWGGPAGANLASGLIQFFGVLAYILSLSVLFLGVTMILGWVKFPLLKRLAGVFFITLFISSLFGVQFPSSHGSHFVLGYGGWIGSTLGPFFSGIFGAVGATIILSMLTLASLVVTGNFTLLKYGRRQTDETKTQATHRRRTDESSDEDAHEVYPIGENTAVSQKPKKQKSSEDQKSESSPPIELDLSSSAKSKKPETEFFVKSPAGSSESRDFSKIAEDLEKLLLDFKIEVKVSKISEGPVVITFELSPSPGTKVSKIMGLSDDLARLLKTQSVRVLPSIPGKDTVGVEIPNPSRRTVRFGDLVGALKKTKSKDALPLVMGTDTFGAPIIEDLTQMPHMLIAGATGSGKSVFMNTVISSLLATKSAKDLRFVMIDPKMIELAPFEKIPHLACPVVTDPRKEALEVLTQLVTEMDLRYKLMGMLGVKNIAGFNDVIKSRKKGDFKKYTGKWQTMPHVVLVVDEFADMMQTSGKEVEDAITRLAQKARASGIHLVIATQRPSVNVVTGSIKANFATRVAFRVLSGVDSRTILDHQGAEKLLGKGDLLFQSAQGMSRLHAPFLEEAEVAKLVKKLS